jgi:hypothetical protein
MTFAPTFSHNGPHLCVAWAPYTNVHTECRGLMQYFHDIRQPRIGHGENQKISKVLYNKKLSVKSPYL